MSHLKIIIGHQNVFQIPKTPKCSRLERSSSKQITNKRINGSPEHNKRPIFALLCLVFIGYSGAGSLAAQDYVGICGQLHIAQRTWQNPDVMPHKSDQKGKTNEWTIDFNCVVGTNNWQLEGNFSSNGHHTWYFDGTNICEGSRIVRELPQEFTTNLANAFLVPSLESAKTNLTISIRVTPGYPPGDVGVNILWLAFCSGTYLKGNGRVLPLPASIIGHASDAFGYSDQTETFNDGLGLPKKVDFLTSATLYDKSAREFFEPRFGPLKEAPVSGKPDGLRKFFYIATESTNFAGWTFPIKFAFSEEIPETFGKALRTHSGYAVVTGIASSSPPGGPFDKRLSQTVVDWRFRNATKEVDAIIYRSTNTAVDPTNDPALQTRFRKTLDRAPTK